MDAAKIKNESAKSLKWSFLGEFFAKIAVPLSTMFLARILSPEIYGIATAVTIVMTFCETVLENGFAKYIIQHDFADEEEQKKSFTVLFWFSLVASILSCLVIFFLRYPLSQAIGNDGYEFVLVVATAQIPFATLSALFAADLKRSFKFNKLFVVRMVYCLIPFAVTLPLALAGLSYWALVIGTIAAQFIQLVVLILISKKKIEFYFSFQLLGKVLKKAFPMIFESIIIWVCTWTSTLLATQLFDTEVVGLIKVSNSTVASIFALFATSFTSVLFPTLSRLKDNQEEFEDSFYSIQQASFCLLLPIGLGCFFYSDLITRIFLGSGWMQASFIIGVFALTKPLNCCFNNFLSEVFRSKGHFYSSVLYQLFMLIVDITLRLTIGRISLRSYILVNIAIDVIINAVALMILKYRYHFSMKKQFKALAPALACSLSMLAIILSSSEFIGESFLANTIQIIGSMSIYFMCFVIFFPKQFKMSLVYLKLSKPLKLPSKITNQISKTINRDNPKIYKKKLGITALFIASVSLLFFGGLFNKNTYYESSAKELTDIVKNENENIYLSCYPKGEFDCTKKERFSRDMNAQFREINPFRCIIYSEAADNNWYIDEFDEFGQNLSILPATYFTNTEDKATNDFVFDRYPMSVMFKATNTDRNGLENFAYITKKQATYLMEKENLKDYKDVLNREMTLVIDGTIHTWKIANIFNDNLLFAQIADNVLGNYIVCGAYRPIEIQRNERFLFSFDENEYYNGSQLKTIKKNFQTSEFGIDFYKDYTEKNPDTDFNRLVNRLNGDGKSLEWLFYSLFVVSAIIFGFTCYNALSIRNSKVCVLFDILTVLFIWSIFKLLGRISIFTNIMSYLSMLVFLIFSIAYIVCSICTAKRYRYE